MDKTKRVTVPSECGFLETVTVQPYGNIIAKFDTGNSASAPTIHADKFKISGGNITWTLNGKTLTSKIKRKVKVDVGGLNDYTEERYAILLDLEFTGTLYKGVEFLIDDRGDRTPILFNRQIMRMLKVSVNPERKYIITTKYNLD